MTHHDPRRGLEDIGLLMLGIVIAAIALAGVVAAIENLNRIH